MSEYKKPDSGSKPKKVSLSARQTDLFDVLKEEINEGITNNQTLESKPYYNYKQGLSRKREIEIVDYSLEIAGRTAADANAIVYMPRVLIQATLPYMNPRQKIEIIDQNTGKPKKVLGENPKFWERRNGNYSLMVRAGMGYDREGNPIEYDYPYGKWPRLLAPWIGKQIKEKKQREICIGRTVTDLLNQLNVGLGGKNRNNFLYRSECFFAAEYTFSYKKKEENEKGGGWSVSGIKREHIVSEELSFWQWLDPKNADKEKVIRVSESFYEEVTQHGVPQDVRALNAFGKNCFDIDLYSILNYEVFLSMIGKKKSNYIDFFWLKNRLGANYSSFKEFKKDIKKSLKRVRNIWRDLSLEVVCQRKNGLEIETGFKVLTKEPHVGERKSYAASTKKLCYEIGQAKRQAENPDKGQKER